MVEVSFSHSVHFQIDRHSYIPAVGIANLRPRTCVFSVVFLDNLQSVSLCRPASQRRAGLRRVIGDTNCCNRSVDLIRIHFVSDNRRLLEETTRHDRRKSDDIH